MMHGGGQQIEIGVQVCCAWGHRRGRGGGGGGCSAPARWTSRRRDAAGTRQRYQSRTRARTRAGGHGSAQSHANACKHTEGMGTGTHQGRGGKASCDRRAVLCPVRALGARAARSLPAGAVRRGIACRRRVREKLPAHCAVGARREHERARRDPRRRAAHDDARGWRLADSAATSVRAGRVVGGCERGWMGQRMRPAERVFGGAGLRRRGSLARSDLFHSGTDGSERHRREMRSGRWAFGAAERTGGAP
jgi:hypothetical protein